MTTMASSLSLKYLIQQQKSFSVCLINGQILTYRCIKEMRNLIFSEFSNGAIGYVLDCMS